MENATIQGIEHPPIAHTHTGEPPPDDQPEDGCPQIRARLAADKIAARRNRTASPCDHVYGYVPGGRSENLTLPW